MPSTTWTRITTIDPRELSSTTDPLSVFYRGFEYSITGADEPKKQPTQFKSKSKADEWEDKNHVINKIADLTSEHIENILLAFEEGKDFWQQAHKYEILEKELTEREKKGLL